MSFAAGELQSIFHFIMFIPLLLEIPVYLSALHKMKTNNNIYIHRIYLVITNVLVIISFVNYLINIPGYIFIFLIIISATSPLFILDLMDRYHKNKSITAPIVILGIYQFLIWLSCAFIFLG